MITLPWSTTAAVIKPTRVITITRKDGTVVRIAEAQNDVTVDAETWAPQPGFELSAIKRTSGGRPDTCTITVASTPTDTVFNSYEIADRMFDDATVQVYAVDRANPTSAVLFMQGTIGRTVLSTTGLARFDVRSKAIKIQNPYSQTYSIMCRTDLGSSLCKIPLLPNDVARGEDLAVGDVRRARIGSAGTPDDYANVYFEVTKAGTTGTTAPAYPSAVGSVFADGTVNFRVKDAWTRYARVASVTDQFTFVVDRLPDPRAVDNWYAQGAFVMRSGYGLNLAFEIGRWQSADRIVTSYVNLGRSAGQAIIAAGDWLELWPGCDFRIVTCAGKFSNAKNFRGEPYFQGAAAAAQTMQGA